LERNAKKSLIDEKIHRLSRMEEKVKEKEGKERQPWKKNH